MASVETNNELYVAADTAARAEDWPALWALRDRFRATGDWPGAYGPACAIAGWHVDRDAGEALLDEVIDAGFHQPDLWRAEFAESFATEPSWPARLDRMRANVPPPSVTLTEWPDYPPVLAPMLDRLAPDREALLRERLPEPAGAAWETALRLLDWTTSGWEHANGHVDNRDAVEVLDRVAAGERFACVEYSIVLTQALNAARIPARTLALRMRDYHTGVGRGHVVSEAWIDDLGRWVVLDGQNGAWWGDSQPLGILDLIERESAADRPPMNSRRHELSDVDQADWFSYFASATTTGLTWSDGPYVPVFQDRFPVRTERLVHGSDAVAPDLGAIATALVDADGPGVAFTPLHPFATAVSVADADGSTSTIEVGGPLALGGDAGVHTRTVSAVTPYATLRAHTLSYDVSDRSHE
jgi:hypothetical protein